MVRAMQPAGRASAFSPTWVVIGYFLALGGIAISATAFAMTRSTSLVGGLAAFAGGAAFGGFYAGRASPHRAILEPALAGALVVGSVVALLKATTLGDLLFVIESERATQTALILGGAGFGGGAIGTLIGELTQPRDPGWLPLRFGWLSILVACGALAASGIAAGVLMVDAAAQEALARGLRGEAELGLALDQNTIVTSAAVALAVASLVAGFVTQLAAPRRMLLPAALGAPAVVGGGLTALAAMAGRLADLVAPTALIAATAFAVALVGALLAWLAGRATGRLS